MHLSVQKMAEAPKEARTRPRRACIVQVYGTWDHCATAPTADTLHLPGFRILDCISGDDIDNWREWYDKNAHGLCASLPLQCVMMRDDEDYADVISQPNLAEASVPVPTFDGGRHSHEAFVVACFRRRKPQCALAQGLTGHERMVHSVARRVFMTHSGITDRDVQQWHAAGSSLAMRHPRQKYAAVRISLPAAWPSVTGPPRSTGMGLQILQVYAYQPDNDEIRALCSDDSAANIVVIPLRLFMPFSVAYLVQQAHTEPATLPGLLLSESVHCAATCKHLVANHLDVHVQRLNADLAEAFSAAEEWNPTFALAVEKAMNDDGIVLHG